MKFKSWSKVITSIILLAMLASLPLLSACSSDDDTDDTGDTGDTTLDVFDVIQAAVQDYLGSSPKWAMSADDLETLITNTSTADDPIIVDTRGADNYNAGHITGAINIPLATLAASASLAQLDKDTQIVTQCVTGHTGSQAAAILNFLGYDGTATAKTTTLKFAMCGWDPAQQTSCYTAPTAKAVVTAASTGGSYSTPDLGTSTDTESEILIAAAQDYLGSSPKWTMSADDLETLITNTSTADDPIIVDVRSADSYNAGHIEGAINIPLATLAADASLAQLDPDKQIVTYCVTGHTGSQAAALLNLLGYTGTATAKTTTLKHGMCGWDPAQQTSCYTAPTAKTVVTS